MHTRTAMLVVAMVVAAGCSGTHHRGGASATELPAQATGQPGAVTAALEVGVTSVKSGHSVGASVKVDNLTGHAIPAVACGSLYQVLLASKSSHPTPTWLTCAQAITVPMGVSTYPVVIEATYYGASGRALPTGIYQATIYEMGNALPVPPPITMRVTR